MRAVRWQRIAPAFGVKEAVVALDRQTLTDTWTFHQGETWADFVWGKTIQQGAPARVSRGMELVEVMPGFDGKLPFVVASRHPNGAVAIAALPRTQKEKGIFLPLVNITLPLPNLSQPLGLFGRFQSVRLKLNAPLDKRRIWDQDLAGDGAEEITNRVQVEGNDLILSRELIDAVGLAAANAGDESGPGLVLQIR